MTTFVKQESLEAAYDKMRATMEAGAVGDTVAATTARIQLKMFAQFVEAMTDEMARETDAETQAKAVVRVCANMAATVLANFSLHDDYEDNVLVMGGDFVGRTIQVLTSRDESCTAMIDTQEGGAA